MLTSYHDTVVRTKKPTSVPCSSWSPRLHLNFTSFSRNTLFSVPESNPRYNIALSYRVSSVSSGLRRFLSLYLCFVLFCFLTLTVMRNTGQAFCRMFLDLGHTISTSCVTMDPWLTLSRILLACWEYWMRWGLESPHPGPVCSANTAVIYGTDLTLLGVKGPRSSSAW